MKDKIIKTTKEIIGYTVTGIGSYLVLLKGVTMINVLILILGITGVLLNFPGKKKETL